MAIRYKIIRTKDRTSVYVSGKYKLKYIKDQIVKSIPGTLGLMVFEKKQQAEDFMKSMERFFVFGPDTVFMIRVEAHSRGKVPKNVSLYMRGDYLDEFYNKNSKNSIYKTSPPMGTICYDQIKVLD